MIYLSDNHTSIMVDPTRESLLVIQNRSDLKTIIECNLGILKFAQKILKARGVKEIDQVISNLKTYADQSRNSLVKRKLHEFAKKASNV